MKQNVWLCKQSGNSLSRTIMHTILVLSAPITSVEQEHGRAPYAWLDKLCIDQRAIAQDPVWLALLYP